MLGPGRQIARRPPRIERSRGATSPLLSGREAVRCILGVNKLHGLPTTHRNTTADGLSFVLREHNVFGKILEILSKPPVSLQTWHGSHSLGVSQEPNLCARNLHHLPNIAHRTTRLAQQGRGCRCFRRGAGVASPPSVHEDVGSIQPCSVG